MTTTDAPRVHRATWIAGLVLGVAIIGALVTAVAASWAEDSLLVPRHGGHPVGDPYWSWVFRWCLVGAFAAYAGAALLAARQRLSLRVAIAFGVVIQLLPLAGPLILSTDAWTYWDYGRIDVVHDANPYVQTPAAFPDDPAYPHVGRRWVHTPSVYGPAFTMATAPIALVAGESSDAAAWLFKSLAALAMIAAMLGVGRIARRPALATVVVGWSPLLAVQAGGAGHNDAWIAALAIGAIVAARAGRPIVAGATWAIAALVKWVPLLLVPSIALAALARLRTNREELRVIIRACVGFAIVASITIAIAFARYGDAWLDAFAPLMRNAQNPSGYSLTVRLELLGAPTLVARFLPYVLLGIAGLVVLLDALRGRTRSGLVMVAIVACSPLIAPWYLLWAVPLATTDEDDTVPIVIAVVLSAALLLNGIPIRSH
ncbi:MAG: glycosyltransferase 87 family protein [Kofleriaceae bacterium]